MIGRLIVKMIFSKDLNFLFQVNNPEEKRIKKLTQFIPTATLPVNDDTDCYQDDRNNTDNDDNGP